MDNRYDPMVNPSALMIINEKVPRSIPDLYRIPILILYLPFRTFAWIVIVVERKENTRADDCNVNNYNIDVLRSYCSWGFSVGNYEE